MWAFPDKKGRPCCLIPEATALFQERCKELLAQRTERALFYVTRCYRYERPQAGRYREFTQLGFEFLVPDPERALARSTAIAKGFLDSLGLRYELDTLARRGLSYYLNGQGFEIRCSELGAQQQVVGGGPIVKEPVSESAPSDCCSPWRRKAFCDCTAKPALT